MDFQKDNANIMENLIKKLEEQIAFLQHEISQMSDELYSQQKEVY